MDVNEMIVQEGDDLLRRGCQQHEVFRFLMVIQSQGGFSVINPQTVLQEKN